MKKILIALLFALLGSFQNVAAADDEITSQDLCNLSHSEYSNLNNEKLLDMKYEEYALALTCVKAREDAAKAEIATLEGEIAGLNTQVDETKAAIVSKWNEMLAFVGITQAEYDAFVANLDAFISKVRGFEGQFSGDLKAWAAALADGDKEFEEIKANKIAVFPRLDPKIADAGRALDDSKSALAAAKASQQTSNDSYTVRLIPERRDCLWRIAEYSEIYGDPFKWPQIYSANKDQIKDENLIFPGQVFTIPR